MKDVLIFAGLCFLSLNSCIEVENRNKQIITSVYQIEHCSTQKRDTVTCVGRVVHYSKNGAYPIFCYTDTIGEQQELMNYCNAKLLKQTIQ